MKSTKRYSNTTFSKRVDHDAGQHKTPRASAEPASCGVCGAVYSDRRWTSAGAARKIGKHRHWRPNATTICPACKQQKEGVAAGFVYLSGDFVPGHAAEIERLLSNEAARAAVDNPLSRIMSNEKDESGRLVVTTTTEHLAERLGQVLGKAFAGKVRYDFSHENKLARVYWHRD